jgi:hypothetical protein
VDDAGAFCAFVRPDGRRCRGRPRTGSTLCFAHDPASKEARAAACRTGGKKRSQRAVTLDPDGPDAELKTVADVVRFLAAVVNATAKGRLDSRVANSCIYGLATMAAAISKSDLEQRLAAVERLLAKGKAGVV